MSKAVQKELKFAENEIREIPLNQIEPDKNQIRKEFNQAELDSLIESIKNDGQIQPILVTKGSDGNYQIVDGERRWRALNNLVEQVKDDAGLIAKFSKIKAIYVEESNELRNILGNMLRNNYNPIETADAIASIKRILGDNAKDIDIAKRIGKSRTTVVGYNSLLNLPTKIQDRARLDSCVPLRKLITLAADKTKSAAEKIAQYDELHKKYVALRDTGKEKKVYSKSLQTMDTRKVAGFRKKLDDMKSDLGNLKFGGKLDTTEKSSFLKSLKEIIDTAQATLKRLT